MPTLQPTSVGMASSRSASGQMIDADLPPSSRTARLIWAPQISPIRRPTAVEPVKLTMSTPGCRTRCSAAAGPAATKFSTPGVKPTSSASSARTNEDSGFCSGTFTTTVHPATRAGADFWAKHASAKL